MHLFCWHEFRVNKHFTICPLKMEFLSRNPDVVQVHEAFSHAEVVAISATDFSSDVVNSTKHQIDQKLGSLTGLEARGPDTVQLVSHLPGGHSDIHIDFVSLLNQIVNFRHRKT